MASGGDELLTDLGGLVTDAIELIAPVQAALRAGMPEAMTSPDHPTRGQLRSLLEIACPQMAITLALVLSPRAMRHLGEQFRALIEVTRELWNECLAGLGADENGRHFSADEVFSVTFGIERRQRRAFEGLAFLLAWVAERDPEAWTTLGLPNNVLNYLVIDQWRDVFAGPRGDGWVWSVRPAPDPHLTANGTMPSTALSSRLGIEVEKMVRERSAIGDHSAAERYYAILRATLDRLHEPFGNECSLLSALGSAIARQPLNLSETRFTGMFTFHHIVYPIISVDLTEPGPANQWYLLDHMQRGLVLAALKNGLGWSQIHYAWFGADDDPGADALANVWFKQDREVGVDPMALAETFPRDDSYQRILAKLGEIAGARDRNLEHLRAELVAASR